jgi:hypothetical protein
MHIPRLIKIGVLPELNLTRYISHINGAWFREVATNAEGHWRNEGKRFAGYDTRRSA